MSAGEAFQGLHDIPGTTLCKLERPSTGFPSSIADSDRHQPTIAVSERHLRPVSAMASADGPWPFTASLFAMNRTYGLLPLHATCRDSLTHWRPNVRTTLLGLQSERSRRRNCRRGSRT